MYIIFMFISPNALLALKIVRLYPVAVIFKLFNGLYRINSLVDFSNFKLLPIVKKIRYADTYI